MNCKSIWLKDYSNKDNRVLNHDIEVDVLIIGGGLTGLNAAYFLKDSSLNVCIVEKNSVGMGVSSKTTGKINYLQETIYSDLEKKYSYNVAAQYFNSQKLAIKKYCEIIKNENINCNLEQVTSYVYTNEKSEISKIIKEKELLEKLHQNVLKMPKNLVNDLEYGIGVEDTFVIHPIKYILALKKICQKKGLKIYEKTAVLKLIKANNNYICLTNRKIIKAKKVIIACHYPFFLKPFLMPIMANTEKSYILATKIQDYKKYTYITSKNPCQSVRFHNDKNAFLIYLSNSHNIVNDLDNQKNFEEVKNKLNKKVDYIWSNDDLITIDKLPYIGYLEKNNNNLLIGTGYNTWGMTNSMVAGVILSDLVLNNSNEFQNIFDPLRVKNISNFWSITKNIGYNIKSYVTNKIVKNKKWYSSHVKFKKINGKSVGIYYDGKKEHIVFNKCPHLGCSLIFNEVEKTWECPCHASIFDIDGNCIKGPSTKDIKVDDNYKN